MPEAGKSEERRKRIGEALIALVVREGFEATSEGKIAARAGVSEAEFHSLYADKQECADRVWEELSSEFIAGLKAVSGGPEPWRERVRAAAYYAIRYFEDDQRRGTFFALGALGVGEVAQARRDRILEAAVDLIDEGRGELEDPDSVPRSRAEAAIGAVYRAIVEANRASVGEVDPGWLPQLMYVVVLPYLGAEAAEEELRRGPEDFARFERGEI
jgi:AcrR family transcriptional regulator